MSINKFNLALLSLMIFMNGCAAERNFIRAFNDPADQRREVEQIIRVKEALSHYIGKDSSALINQFGKPTRITENRDYKGKVYEQEWLYYYSKGIFLINQNTWAYIFYLNNDVVEAVDFL